MTPSRRNWDLRTWDLRPIWFGITVMLLIAFAFEYVFLYRVIDDQTAVGVDHRFYRRRRAAAGSIPASSTRTAS